MLTLTAGFVSIRPPGGGPVVHDRRVLWVLWGLVTVTLLGHAAVSTSRDRRIVRSLNSLVAQGRHSEVLDHPLPSRRTRGAVRLLQAGCAVRTGRYAVALALLQPSGEPLRGAHAEGADLVRGSALVGLGRYSEAAALLGDRPADAALAHVRAAVALEVGDDALTEDLLMGPHTDELAEAGRLRLLGDLRLRRGRLQEARALLTRARSLYARLDDPGTDVDEAFCSVLLARLALLEGSLRQAVAFAHQGLAGLRRQPDNAAGLAEAHAVAAEASAAVDDPVAAQEHLRQAHGQAAHCGSPALDAELARAAGLVSLRLREPSEARRWLEEAARRHEELGARPAAEQIRLTLESLDG